MNTKTIRIEVKVDGKILEVFETEVSENDTSKFWDFMYGVKKSMGEWNFAKFWYK